MARKYFGTDGIRDAAGQGLLAPDRVVAYGQALGAWLAGQHPSGARVFFGRDPRESGPEILDELSAGLMRFGHHVVDGGILSTPAVQSLCRAEGFDLAVVISASHNPASDNGIKFFGPDGRKLKDEVEIALEELMDAPRGAGGGDLGESRSDETAAERYLALLAARFEGLDLGGMRVVLDCAHGAASAFGARALEQFGAEVILRGAVPDGQNINAGAGVFYVAELAGPVAEAGACIGLALDGDADRVLLMDESGSVRDGDHILGILALDLLSRGALPEERVVTTVMANMGLFAFLAEAGVCCDTVPVGDRHVAARMAETGAALGGEQSGHIIFHEGEHWYGDGLHTALTVLEVMKRRGLPLSVLGRGIEKYPQRMENLRVREKPPVESVPELMAAMKEVEGELADLGRVVLRYSGTEPLLRVMVEARHEEMVDRSLDTLMRVARSSLGVS